MVSYGFMTDEICRYKHGVSRCANFDGFQIVAGSFSSVSSFPFYCFVFDINQLKVKFVFFFIQLRKRTPNKLIA